MKRGLFMYNEIPFINPYNNYNPQYNNPLNENELDKILDKIERIEKQIRILEKRINNLENNNNYTNYQIDNVNDMHII